MITTRVYRSGVLEASDIDPTRVSDLLEEPDVVVWLDVCDPTGGDIAVVAEEFGLHPLAVEDAVKAAQRPKVDRYGTHLFIATDRVRFVVDSGLLTSEQVGVFVAPRWLITVRRDPDAGLDDVLARWDQSPDLAKHGVSHLLHGVLDVVVDDYFTAVQSLDDALEQIEDLLFEGEGDPPRFQRRVYTLRKSLVALRRVVLPMREVLNTLLRRDLDVVPAEMTPYYQDVYDHVLRAAEWTESMRDLVTSLLETQLTMQSNRLNEIMKRLTGWAAIIAVPTAIAGVYGMNFELVPASGSLFGFWFALALIVVSATGLYLYFRGRSWI